MRSDADSHLDELRRVGMLFDTPEQAARRVDEVVHATPSSLRDPSVQACRSRIRARQSRVAAGVDGSDRAGDG
jgi:hypothetical protein